MRVNIGKGYVVEQFDSKSTQITVSSDIVEVYFPEDLKKMSHLNRYPVAGDVVLLQNGISVLLVAVWREENAEEAQDELIHVEKILNESGIETVMIDKTEAPFTKLLQRYEKEEEATEKTLAARQLKK